MRFIFSWLDALAVKIVIFKKNILKSCPNHCIYPQDAEWACSIVCRKEESNSFSPLVHLGIVSYTLESGELSRERGGGQRRAR